MNSRPAQAKDAVTKDSCVTAFQWLHTSHNMQIAIGKLMMLHG